MAIGHEYMVQTDHSARLTIAHGLNEDRLAEQLDQIAARQRRHRRGRTRLPDPVGDGGRHPRRRLARPVRRHARRASTSWSPACTRSCAWRRQQMTERMVMAVASPHVDILGHCTGRMIGKRPPSEFDADYVFAACAQFGTAVEINCRPERLDPPRELLDVAIEYGCWFSIDSDAHATGQLEWQPLGLRPGRRARACRSTDHQHASRPTTSSPGLPPRPPEMRGRPSQPARAVRRRALRTQPGGARRRGGRRRCPRPSCSSRS